MARLDAKPVLRISLTEDKTRLALRVLNIEALHRDAHGCTLLLSGKMVEITQEALDALSKCSWCNNAEFGIGRQPFLWFIRLQPRLKFCAINGEKAKENLFAYMKVIP